MSAVSDLLERFRRGPELVAAALTGAAGPELDYKPSPDKWSIRQIMAHLADSEMVGADRIRRVIAEGDAQMLVYDEKAWAERLDYHRRKPSQALETFRRVRSENHDLLKDMPEDVFERSGTHSVKGKMTLTQVVLMYAEHAEAHAQQIRAARAAWKQAKAAGAA